MTQARSKITLTVLAISLLTGLITAQTKQDEQAPLPTQIVAAKKVFIANGGGDDPGMPDPLFNGGGDRPYNQFYAAIKSSGRYELVGSPAEADLLLDIRFMVVPDRRPTGFGGRTERQTHTMPYSASKFVTPRRPPCCGHSTSTWNGPF
jgi:hypothetical protein